MVASERYHCESYSTGGNHLGKQLSSKQCSAGGCLAWVSPANVKVLFLLPKNPWDELWNSLVMICLLNVRMEVYLGVKYRNSQLVSQNKENIWVQTANQYFLCQIFTLLTEFHSLIFISYSSSVEARGYKWLKNMLPQWIHQSLTDLFNLNVGPISSIGKIRMLITKLKTLRYLTS